MIEPQELTAIVESVGEFLLEQLDSTKRELAEARATINGLSERIEALEQKETPGFPVEDLRQAVLEAIETNRLGVLERMSRLMPEPPVPDVSAIVQAEVQRAVSELPKPENGKDAVVDEDVIVQRVVKLIPIPENGKDALPVDEAALAERVLSMIPKPENGKDGTPGVDGKDAPPVDEEALAQRILERIPKPKDGQKGEKGEDGASVHPDTVRLMVAEEVRQAVALIPKAVDGRDGLDAVQIRILPSMDESRGYPEGTYAKYRNGVIRAAKATRPGRPLESGWEVVSEGWQPPIVTQGEDLRTFTIKTSNTSGESWVSEFSVPTMIHQGIWKSGPFKRGDAVTYDNSTWVCREDTTDTPGKSDKWLLAVRKGSNGKDGKDGQKGDPGPEGPAGKDLRYK